MPGLRSRLFHSAARAGLARQVEQAVIERLTPKAVYDLFTQLENDDARAFLRLVADSISAEAIYDMAHCLTEPELYQFSKLFGDELWKSVYPQILKSAIRLARENQTATNEELERMVDAEVRDAIEEHTKSIAELERARVKEKRDRHSDVETVKRNVEICDLRNADKKLWSLRRLAKQFKVTPQYIAKILKSETEWRRLAKSAN